MAGLHPSGECHRAKDRRRGKYDPEETFAASESGHPPEATTQATRLSLLGAQALTYPVVRHQRMTGMPARPSLKSTPGGGFSGGVNREVPMWLGLGWGYSITTTR